MAVAPACPFCKGVVSADLSVYGGNCPHCLLEIPGEDAPTDPGAVLRAKHEAEARHREVATVRRHRVLYGLAGTVALVCLASVGVWVWQQEQLVVYELDDYYVVPIEELEGVPVESAPTEAVASAASPGVRPTKRPTPRTNAGGSSAATPHPDSPPPASDFALMTSTTAGAVGIGGGASIDLSRPDLVLSSDDEIHDMARQVINRSSPQLTNCYQQRLKQVPDLAGAWKVEFTIQETGGVGGVDVTGQGRRDEELEECISRAIANWKFTKIAHDQPVAKTYRFKPAGG